MADWVRQLIVDGGYFGIFLLMIAETVFPPIPSEVIMSLAGFEAAAGHISLPIAIGVGTAGAMVGNTMWYFIARSLGFGRLRPIVERHGRWFTVDWAEIETGERWFRRYGGWFVGLGRVMPTFRTLISVPAGLVRMSLPAFLLWSTIGTLGWVTALGTIGWTLRHTFAQAEQWLNIVTLALVGVMLVWYFWRVATWKQIQKE